jgi:putative redox protein
VSDEDKVEGEVTFEKAKFTLRKVREQLESSGPGASGSSVPARVQITWAGEQRYDTGRPGGPVARIDGTAQSGQGPVDMLLSALASCVAMDITEILKKRKTPVDALSAEVVGRRADSTPRRLVHVRINWRIDGANIDKENAERAVELSTTKYCSVHDSLAHDIAIEWAITLNGKQGDTKKDPTRT